MTELIISVSGLRGIVGESLTPAVALRYAAAYESTLDPGPVVVARDGRGSGPVLRHAILSALAGAGRTVLDLDVAATPTVGVFARHHHAAGAIQITASHNPLPYNGIKLFDSDGRVLSAQSGAIVRDAYQAGAARWKPTAKLGYVETVDDPHADHLERVLATVDVEAIRSRRFRVLLDSNHGAGSRLGTRLLERLGCEVVAIGQQPDGDFQHPPEPLEENLAGVCAQVPEHDCHVGFCQDPDADRLALVDAEGRYVGEEYTVALCAMRALEVRTGPIVINCATSGMTEWLGRRAGVAVYRSAVGEANVADRMAAVSAAYGGEGSGGPIDPKVGLVRDSFVGMAQVLDAMAASGATLRELADRLPKLAMHKAKLTLPPERLPAVMEALAAAFSDAAADREDGLRLAWDDRWLLVRGSNTEPIVRLIAEAPTDAEAAELCQRAGELIRNQLAE